MTFHFLFPSTPFLIKEVDEGYAHEQEQVESLGLPFSFIDIEELNLGKLKLSKHISSIHASHIIYRGWMLREKQYSMLDKLLQSNDKSLLTNTSDYLSSHYITGWYESCKDYTMPTIFAEKDNVSQIMQEKGWSSAFVKDFVKSFTTTQGSVANSIVEACDIAKQIDEYRGGIEGGIALREVTALNSDTEERYFVFQGKAYGRNKESPIPQIVLDITKLHTQPFYSVDIVKTISGKDILIEIGDGQVSDIKKWHVEDFYQIFNN